MGDWYHVGLVLAFVAHLALACALLAVRASATPQHPRGPPHRRLLALVRATWVAIRFAMAAIWLGLMLSYHGRGGPDDSPWVQGLQVAPVVAIAAAGRPPAEPPVGTQAASAASAALAWPARCQMPSLNLVPSATRIESMAAIAWLLALVDNHHTKVCLCRHGRAGGHGPRMAFW